jgi:DNA-binding CsgD family transcriptional regulator
VSSQRAIREQLAGLLETLGLLTAQITASQTAVPRAQVQAQLALSRLELLARQACREAEDISNLLEQPEPAATAAQLSPREMEALRLASEGLTNKEIGYRLGISERTVQYHLNSVFNKTGTNSRAEAVAAAFQRGWM